MFPFTGPPFVPNNICNATALCAQAISGGSTILQHRRGQRDAMLLRVVEALSRLIHLGDKCVRISRSSLPSTMAGLNTAYRQHLTQEGRHLEKRSILRVPSYSPDRGERSHAGPLCGWGSGCLPADISLSGWR